MQGSSGSRISAAGVQAGLLWLMLALAPAAAGPAAEKSIYLVDGEGEVTAVNTDTGQFFDFAVSAKERIEQRLVGGGVAVLVTNQRFAGIGAWPSGWASVRRSAGERVIQAEAEDYSAVVVTSDRILSFNGKTGSWSEARR
jgi:hypothetical protein